jgi:hypothetical protein
MKNYGMVLLSALIILLTGCSSAPTLKSSYDNNAKFFSAPANRALIFIYRNGSEGISETMLPSQVTVSVNGMTLGQTADKTFFRLNVKPGNYAISSLSENVAMLNLTVEAGKIYYVQQEISRWMLSSKSSLQLVDDAKGRASVFESKIIASNVADRNLSVSDTAIAPLEAPASASDSLSEKLRVLQGLKNDGLISEEEFQKKRQQMLEKL